MQNTTTPDFFLESAHTYTHHSISSLFYYFQSTFYWEILGEIYLSVSSKILEIVWSCVFAKLIENNSFQFFTF